MTHINFNLLKQILVGLVILPFLPILSLFLAAAILGGVALDAIEGINNKRTFRPKV